MDKIFVVINEIGKVVGVTADAKKLENFFKCNGWFWDNPISARWSFHFSGGQNAGFVDVFEMDKGL